MENQINQLKNLSAQDVHHLRGAVATLTLALQAIKDGYRFDDALGAAKAEAVETAVERLRAIAYNLSDE